MSAALTINAGVAGRSAPPSEGVLSPRDCRHFPGCGRDPLIAVIFLVPARIAVIVLAASADAVIFSVSELDERSGAAD
jgi:hypothetical protein